MRLVPVFQMYESRTETGDDREDGLTSFRWPPRSLL